MISEAEIAKRQRKSYCLPVFGYFMQVIRNSPQSEPPSPAFGAVAAAHVAHCGLYLFDGLDFVCLDLGLGYLEELDFEDEHLVGSDACGGHAVDAVGEAAGDVEGAFAAGSKHHQYFVLP